MKRMVALTSPTLNESYVEPSPYAWLSSRAPVPTSYAPACEPLYAFREVLKNRTSRARVMTDNCAEAPGRKCLFCIEIWQVELESCVWRVSFHKYAYVHGDPISHVDPNGEFAAVVLGLGVSMMMAGPGDYIKGGLEALVKAYVSNLEWDVEWALDMSLPDSWGSRLDDKWVYAAIGQGLHDAFNIDTPLGTFNPLDLFGGGSDASAFRARGPSGGSSSVFFRGAHKAMHSLTSTVHYAKDAVSQVKNLSARVSYYFHSKLGQHIVRFPKRVKAAVVRIAPTPPPGGVAWVSFTRGTKQFMSQQDILKATSELRRKNGGRLPSGYDEVVDSQGRPTGQLWVNGEVHTWHHSYKKGTMELVPTQLHRESMKNQVDPSDGTVGPHIGQALWWMPL